MTRVRWTKAVLLLLLVTAAVAQQRRLRPGWNLFSKEQDVQLGKEAAAEIEKQQEVINNPDLQAYVSRLGKALVALPEADGYPYTFKVVHDPAINAFALPGGPTYVHTGLIKSADNEAQLVGVMAHEVAHVALRHGTNQASKANLVQLPAVLAGAVFGQGSMLGSLAQLGIGLGANGVLMKFSRTAETEADLLGTRMMSQLGYNPLELARFFEKLEAEGKSPPEFLSSHPNPGNRMKTIEKEITYLSKRQYNAETGQFRRMQQVVERLPAPKARPKQGQGGPTAGGNGEVKPSGKFKQHDAVGFSLVYPDNWGVAQSQDRKSATFAPAAGIFRDQSGNQAIGYGVVTGYHQARSRGDLRQETNDLVANLRQQNKGMDLANQPQRPTKVGGQDGLITILQSPSPVRGEVERDVLITVQRPDGLFYLVFICPDKEAEAFQQPFSEMLRSVRFPQ